MAATEKPKANKPANNTAMAGKPALADGKHSWDRDTNAEYHHICERVGQVVIEVIEQHMRQPCANKPCNKNILDDERYFFIVFARLPKNIAAQEKTGEQRKPPKNAIPLYGESGGYMDKIGAWVPVYEQRQRWHGVKYLKLNLNPGG